MGRITLRLAVAAGAATPGAPIGPALGQRGIKAVDFCRAFNERTAALYRRDLPLRVRLDIDADARAFVFEAGPPATAWLLRRAAGLQGVALQSHGERKRTQPWASVDARVVYEVARAKAADPNLAHVPLRLVFRSVLATARSCGIDVHMPDE